MLIAGHPRGVAARARRRCPGLQQLHSHLFWRSRPGLPGPDLQPLFFHLPMYLEGMQGPTDGYTLMAGVIRPASRGVAAARLGRPGRRRR